MNAWRKLPVAEQEKVMGRSKQDDIEMDDDAKPANSHIALSNVGDEFKVVRDNMPLIVERLFFVEQDWARVRQPETQNGALAARRHLADKPRATGLYQVFRLPLLTA